ncbi:UDP-glucose 4-epimerase [Methylovorus menthalis]|uniref:DapH/DapD/GlmU-related protein n=1 Tax=Methylovorus menthalis TaxID=1002227 RepID=UPI001E2C6DED|nr:DapH/DapD/GlmU-related protein [Methylovorus menthalis]MCB4810079.1 UDP-glucose 4-epimerase [Methylovorus menthalis]
MKKLLIFGESTSLARLNHEIERSALYDIVGIVVAKATTATRYGIPLYTLETLPAFDKQEVSAFIVGDEQHLNQQRLAAYMDVKRMGYAITSFCSSSASIANGLKLRENVFIDRDARVLAPANIGANTWIMQGAQIDADAKIGSSCWIGAQCVISAGATIGKNCTLGQGVVIGPGVVLPAWSTIHYPTTLTESPPNAVFLDARFRAPVYFFQK